MVAITIDGDELTIECPLCEGTGEHNFRKYTDSSKDHPCPVCDGEGMIEDIPCYGEIEVDLEPARMEGL